MFLGSLKLKIRQYERKLFVSGNYFKTDPKIGIMWTLRSVFGTPFSSKTAIKFSKVGNWAVIIGFWALFFPSNKADTRFLALVHFFPVSILIAKGTT